MKTSLLLFVTLLARFPGRCARKQWCCLVLLAVLAVCLEARALAADAAHRLLVKWKDGPQSPAAAAGNVKIGSTVKRSYHAIGWQLVELPAGLSMSEGIKAYQALGTVAFVEPDGVVRREPPLPPSETSPTEAFAPASQPLVPNDPMFSQQWYLSKISATNAWAITTGSTNVVVAVFDRGVNYVHPDLAANMWRNPGETGLDTNGNDKATNGIDDDGNGYVDDVHGVDAENGTGDPRDTGNAMPFDPPEHGTFCAGIIGAAGNNGIGITGLNWKVQIMAIRFAGGDLSNTREYSPRAYWSANLAGWDYVIAMKRRGVNIRVTSHSYGDYFQSASVRDAIEVAGDEGILCVASSGNQFEDNDRRSRFPHGYNLPSVISVAASTQSDTIPEWSNIGQGTIHLAAPGTDFVSVWGNRYTNGWSGTSFSAPLVAAAAALLLSLDPDLTVDRLKAAILGSIDQPAVMKGKLISNGRLNAARALQYLTNGNPAAIVIHASPAGQWTPTNAPIQVTFNRPMNRASVESAFAVTPPITGTFVWSDDARSFAFHHDAPFDFTTNYAVRILGTAQDDSGGTLDGDFDRLREGSPTDDLLWTFRFRIPNDDLANAQWIAGESGRLQSSNRYATFEILEPDHLGDRTSMSSVWYRWMPPESGGWFTFDLTGSTAFDSLLAVYTGENPDRLVAVAANDNYGTRTNSRLSFAAVSGTNYSIVVAGKSGDATKRLVATNQAGPFQLTWYPTPPPAISSFSPSSAYPGQKVTLNGTNFTGATRVLFSGVPAVLTFSTNAAFTDLQLTATLPSDATTGPITIETPHGNITTTSNFTVFVRPLLAIRAVPGTNLVELSWLNTSGFIVQRADNPSTSATWSGASFISTGLTNGIRSAFVTLAPTSRFFRLFRP